VTYLAPGIYDGVSPERYHGDELTDTPALSRSGIVTLLNGTSADFAAANPRLTKWPEQIERDGTDATDLGEIVHAMVLGGLGGAKFIVGDPSEHRMPNSKTGETYKTWTGKAKEWKEARKAEGHIVIDYATNAKAVRIAGILTAALEARFGKEAWANRRVEQTVIWRRILNDGTQIWCKGRPDAILPDGTIVDPKTTALSLSDEGLGKRIALDGLDIQDAFYRDGLAIVEPQPFNLNDAHESKPPFIFAFIRTVPPYTTRLFDLAEEGWPLSTTRMRIDLAAQVFGACLKSGEWPDLPVEAHPVCPGWIKEQWGLQLLEAGILEEESL